MSPKEPASPGTPAAAPAGPAAERDPLERIDLHLIRVLHTVLTEGSVSRAALRLGMHQPAVSAALKRLRELAGDPLLVRHGAQMVATDAGRRMIEPAASILRTAVGPRRCPGSLDGLKNTSLNRSRRPWRRSRVSMPNRNSNIGPPRTAPGSLGLDAKPIAMVPPSIAASRSRMASAEAMPSQGTSACSIPGSLRR